MPQTLIGYNPKTDRILTTRDVTWAEWKRPDPKRNLSFFKKNPEAEQDPSGVDELTEVNRTYNVNRVDNENGEDNSTPTPPTPLGLP